MSGNVGIHIGELYQILSSVYDNKCFGKKSVQIVLSVYDKQMCWREDSTDTVIGV